MNKCVLILFWTIWMDHTAIAQSSKDTLELGRKNAIYGSLEIIVKPLGINYNISYERNIFIRRSKHINSFWIKGSYGNYGSFDSGEGESFGLDLLYVRGKETHFFETGIGIIVFFNHIDYNNDMRNYNAGRYQYGPPQYYDKPQKEEYVYKYPSFTIGYRKQKPGGFFIFKIGTGLPTLLYMRLGFCI